MRNYFLILLFSVVSLTAKEIDLPMKEVVLENEFIRIEILPESMGRISQIIYKKARETKLLAPYQWYQNLESPLFSPIRDNLRGVRELFWGVSNIIRSHNPMNVIEKGNKFIKLSSKYYGNTLFGLERKIEFDENSAVINIKSEIKNQGETTSKHSIWLNFQPTKNVEVQMPIPAGVHKVRGKGIVTCGETEQIFTGAKNKNFMPQARDWCAIYYKNADILMAIRVSPEEFKPDGFFYNWQGKILGEDVKTVEIVGGIKTLKSKEVIIHNWQLLFFKGIKTLLALHDNLAFDARKIDNNLQLTVSAAKDTKENKVELIFNNQKEVIVLPAMRTGEFKNINIKLDNDNKITNLTIIIDKKSIPFVGEITSSLIK